MLQKLLRHCKGVLYVERFSSAEYRVNHVTVCVPKATALTMVRFFLELGAVLDGVQLFMHRTDKMVGELFLSGDENQTVKIVVAPDDMNVRELNDHAVWMDGSTTERVSELLQDTINTYINELSTTGAEDWVQILAMHELVGTRGNAYKTLERNAPSFVRAMKQLVQAAPQEVGSFFSLDLANSWDRSCFDFEHLYFLIS